MAATDQVLQAQANLKEAERQFKHAEEQFQRGEIPKERLDQLGRLRDLAAEDLRRTVKVFGSPIPENERWSGNFRPG
jgi:outer membrane protein TolC